MKKFFKLSFKRRGSERMEWCSEFANSAAEAREMAKARWGDIRIISCVAS